jgi:hypothetical protein
VQEQCFRLIRLVLHELVQISGGIIEVVEFDGQPHSQKSGLIVVGLDEEQSGDGFAGSFAATKGGLALSESPERFGAWGGECGWDLQVFCGGSKLSCSREVNGFGEQGIGMPGLAGEYEFGIFGGAIPCVESDACMETECMELIAAGIFCYEGVKEFFGISETI